MFTNPPKKNINNKPKEETDFKKIMLDYQAYVKAKSQADLLIKHRFSASTINDYMDLAAQYKPKVNSPKTNSNSNKP